MERARADSLDIEPFVPRALLLRDPGDPRTWRAQGSLLMVDLSGFTQLTDRLAESGRAGAEELTATLSRVFTLLLTATDDGGDVLKFGGDALLVFYAGRDSAARACHAALGMQRILRAVGVVQLTTARTTLRMSMGIHTATFDLALVGHRQQELFLAGPEVTEALAQEAAASPGQVRVSAATAEAIGHVGVDALADGGLVLRRSRPLPPTGALFRSRTHAGDLRDLIPLALRDRTELFTEESEHRRAPIGFVMVKGADDLHRAEGPAAVAAAFARITEAIEEAATTHGVTYLSTDVSPDGAKAILVGGIPDAVEDAEGRLLRCLGEVVAVQSPLVVRAGVASGPVFVGPFGPTFRRTYTVMGDAVNLAARIAASAGPGELLADRASAELSSSRFDLGPIRELTLKGKPAPVEALPIGAYRGTHSHPTAEVDFVGRGAERAALGRAAADARTRTVTVDVVGEAGIGKSRLVAEVLGDAVGARVECSPNEQRQPWHALGAVLRGLLGIEASADAEACGRVLLDRVADVAPELTVWTPLLAVPLGASVPPTPEVDDLDDRYRRARLHDVVTRLVAVLAADPTAIVVDDSQWIDEVSAEALAAVVAGVGDAPILVVRCRRDEGEHGAAADVQVRLGPLEPAEAEELLARAVTGPVRAGDRGILERAAGNPLFLLEMARSIDRLASELPASVESIVAARIDRLDVGSRSALRCASVLGNRFPEALFRAVARPAGLRSREVGPELAFFLQRSADGSHQFRRSLYREVAYARTTFRQRRELHRLAGEGLAATGTATAAELSWHFAEAQEWELARDHSIAAASHAEEVFAPEEAVAMLQRAIHSARRAGDAGPEVAAMHERLGDAADHAARYDIAADAYRTARRATDAPIARARLLERSGRMCERVGRYSAAIGLYTRARGLLAEPPDGPDPETDRLLAEVDIATAGARFRQGRFADCVALCEAAVLTARRLDDTRLLAHACSLSDTAVVEVDGPSATRYGELPVELYAELGLIRRQSDALNNLGYRAYFLGDWPAAVDYYERALTLAERAGDTVAAATYRSNLGEILSDQGRLVDAGARFAAALETYEAAGYPVGVALVVGNQGRLARRQGDHAAAEALLADARDRFAAIDAGSFVAEMRLRQAELALASGRVGPALEEVASLAAQPDSADAAPAFRAAVARVEGLARTAAGDQAGALVSLSHARAIAEAGEATYEWALTVLALARIGAPEGMGALDRARTVLDDLGVETPDEVLVTG